MQPTTNSQGKLPTVCICRARCINNTMTDAITAKIIEEGTTVNPSIEELKIKLWANKKVIKKVINALIGKSDPLKKEDAIEIMRLGSQLYEIICQLKAIGAYEETPSEFLNWNMIRGIDAVNRMRLKIEQRTNKD
jgi:hypothetical protein